ncbi:g1730 [Coccomyxa elongata]
MAPKHQEPARGALAGLKADVDRAKQAALLGEDYNPAIPGVGAAWSHNFLNQKPWHPLNYRNQMKVFEAQQKAEADAKAKAIGKAEFDAEQEYLKTLSYLSPEDQQKHRDRQGVSFMYQKPPGYDAAMSKAAQQKPDEAEKSSAAAEAPTEAAASQQGGRRERAKPGLPKEYVANMLGAISALHQHEKYEVRHVSGGGQRSPPRGGFDLTAENQQLLVDEPDEDAMIAGTSGHHRLNDDSSDSEQHRERKKLKQAEAYLKAAGIDLPFKKSGKKEKKKTSKKQKKEKKSKRDR